jgi:hypothetical protein
MTPPPEIRMATLVVGQNCAVPVTELLDEPRR